MSRRIEDLLPEVQEKAAAFIDGCLEANIPVCITQTLRTWEEQDELYAQGRTKPGKIVTKARGGYSWHNFGRAFDIVPLKDGKADWSAPAETWKKLGEIGRAAGLEWGGDWASFKDLPHFQYVPDGLTLAQARAEHGK